MLCIKPLIQLHNKAMIKYYGKSFINYNTLTYADKKQLHENIKQGNLTCYPCRQCLACINMFRYSWVKKCAIEKQKGNNTYFITLTYNKENLPKDENNQMVLNVKDAQNFIKYFRKLIYPSKLKYLIAGEYGTQHGRPHYHAIIFTNYFLDLKFTKYSKKSSHPLFTCDIIDKAGRNKGGTGIAHDFDEQSFAYTVSYSNKQKLKQNLNKMKKANEQLLIDISLIDNMTDKEKIQYFKEHKFNIEGKPEFLIMSKKPPIGSEFRMEMIDEKDIPSNTLKGREKKLIEHNIDGMKTIIAEPNEYRNILDRRKQLGNEFIEQNDMQAVIERNRTKYGELKRLNDIKKHTH